MLASQIYHIWPHENISVNSTPTAVHCLPFLETKKLSNFSYTAASVTKWTDKRPFHNEEEIDEII